VIYGVGTDLIEISRVERALARFGARFSAHAKPAAYLAKRFAAKEAFTKALGTGIRAPANWHGVWVVNHRSGKPQLEFSAALGALLRSRGILRSHLTLTDERGMAAATVILECDG
jgi:holo-[acyl-carrier protein] synthase